MCKKQKLHTGRQSFIFLSFELFHFRWYSIGLPYLACITQISMSLLAMYLPKLVLDAVEQQSNIIHMQQIIMVGIVFTMMTVINMIVFYEEHAAGN